MNLAFSVPRVTMLNGGQTCVLEDLHGDQTCVFEGLHGDTISSAWWGPLIENEPVSL